MTKTKYYDTLHHEGHQYGISDPPEDVVRHVVDVTGMPVMRIRKVECRGRNREFGFLLKLERLDGTFLADLDLVR
jgi:hypothetical protein